MENEQIRSLEVLQTKVINPESKRLIGEAISAYHGCAFRAAIMSTWVAVCYDAIAKLRELAYSDDAAARQKVELLDKWIKNKAVREFQNFENSIVTLIAKEFDMLLCHEEEDLMRLQKDRNLCAHPAFVSSENLFNPTPELVRVHIVHSIIHLLSKRAIGGKSILSRIDRDISQGIIPQTRVELDSLSRDYLATSKESVFHNIIKALIHSIVGSEYDKYISKETSIASLFSSMGRINPKPFEEIVPTEICKMGQMAGQPTLENLFYFVATEPRVWEWLGDVGRARMISLLNGVLCNTSTFSKAILARDIPEIGSKLLSRMKETHFDKMLEYISLYTCRSFVNEAISIYGSSASFRSAEWNGTNVVLPYSKYLTKEDVENIVTGIISNKNDQIMCAGGTSDILINLFNNSKQALPAASGSWLKLAQSIRDKQLAGSYNYSKLLELLSVSSQ